MSGIIEVAMFGARATSLVSNVGTDVLIGTITKSSSSIISGISYLMTNTQPGVDTIITTVKRLDLEFTVNIIDQLVKEQEGNELPESVKKALIGVSQILESINRELETIKKAVEYHESKYFKSWRGFYWEGNIATIQNYSDILKNRYNILVDLLKIAKK